MAPERGEAQVPYRGLDRALAPLRRTVGWVLDAPTERVTSLRYFEQNGARWSQAALASDLPDAIREMLIAVQGSLEGFDALEGEERLSRISSIYQQINRVDAVLGLPLPYVRPARKEARQRTEEPESRSSSRSGRRKKGRRRDRGSSDSSPAPAVEAAARRSEPAPAPAKDSQPASNANDGGGIAYFEKPLPLQIGEDIVQQLSAAGIDSVGELLFSRPTGETVIPKIQGAGRGIAGGLVAVGGRVRLRGTVLRPDGSQERFARVVGAGPLMCRWSSDRVWSALRVGSRVVLAGEAVADEDGHLFLQDAEYAVDDGNGKVRLCEYGIEGVDDRAMRYAVSRLLPSVDGIRDPVPSALRPQLPSFSKALAEIHRRGSAAKEARERLAWTEALLVHLGLFAPRFQGNRERGITHTAFHGLVSKLVWLADAELSDAQVEALDLIRRDLRQPTPMRRVLTGEVGMGKGLVGLATAVTVAENKSQVAFLFQTSVIAEQAFLFAEPLLREVGLVARLMTDVATSAQQDALRRGEVHIVYGTHELLRQGVEFRRLGLVVAEERDHFGSVARAVTALRTPRPDLLIINPVPVVPEILFTAYAGFDVIPMWPDTAPSRREGAHFSTEDRDAAYAVARKAIAAGGQVLVVFPMVNDADALDSREAMRIVSVLSSQVFPGARVSLYHGGLAREERHRVFEDFRHHRADVLVATTCFENGPPIPKARVIVVEQADRMTPTRLHRVRGHLASSDVPEGCLYIIGSEPDEQGVERVQEAAEGRSGRHLARRLYTQYGIQRLTLAAMEPPRFRWLDLGKDAHLLAPTQLVARRIVDGDGGIRRGPNGDIGRLLRYRWGTLFHDACPLPALGSGGNRRRRRRKRR